MRKILTIIASSLLVLLIPIQSSASVSYKTETLTADGEVVETQAAYIPIKVFGKDVEIVHPEDIFMDHENHLYIADSGTKRVTKFDELENKLQVYGDGL